MENLEFIKFLICSGSIIVPLRLLSIKYELKDTKLDVTKINMTHDIESKNNLLDLSVFENTIFEDKINIFCNSITNNISEDNLVLFYNNINSLNIELKDFSFLNFLLKRNTNGAYSYMDNIILLNKNIYSKVIFHELEHLSSSLFVDNVSYCGFSQAFNHCVIGSGINEGYTEVLTRRYFSEYDINESYNYLTYIIKKLELVIGEDKMNNFYYNASLYGLVDELKNYSMLEEIGNFIINTDYLCGLYKKLNNFDIKLMYNNIINSLKGINDYLTKIYIVKQYKLLNANKVSEDEIDNNINSFINSLPVSITLNNKKIEFYNDEDNLLYDEIYDYIKLNNLVLERKK